MCKLITTALSECNNRLNVTNQYLPQTIITLNTNFTPQYVEDEKAEDHKQAPAEHAAVTHPLLAERKHGTPSHPHLFRH